LLCGNKGVSRKFSKHGPCIFVEKRLRDTAINHLPLAVELMTEIFIPIVVRLIPIVIRFKPIAAFAQTE
jgi:hypothetical protein